MHAIFIYFISHIKLAHYFQISRFGATNDIVDLENWQSHLKALYNSINVRIRICVSLAA
jgi:hypothetical protein